MSFDIAPQRFWSLPMRMMDWDEEDLLPTAGLSNGLTIAEDEIYVYIRASVPGVDPKDVEMTFDKGVLWIKAESKEEEKDKKFYRKASSKFSYRVVVPGDIDMSIEPEATCNHGVMEVKFAKSPKSQPKKIIIKANK